MIPCFLRLLALLFFFNDTATTEIYTLSLHDALPIYLGRAAARDPAQQGAQQQAAAHHHGRSEEHTSELQSPDHLVCRLLLEKKNTIRNAPILALAAGGFPRICCYVRPGSLRRPPTVL